MNNFQRHSMALWAEHQPDPLIDSRFRSEYREQVKWRWENRHWEFEDPESNKQPDLSAAARTGWRLVDIYGSFKRETKGLYFYFLFIDGFPGMPYNGADWLFRYLWLIGVAYETGNQLLLERLRPAILYIASFDTTERDPRAKPLEIVLPG